MRERHRGIVIGQLPCLSRIGRSQGNPVINVQNTRVTARGPNSCGRLNLILFCVDVTKKPVWARDTGAGSALILSVPLTE